MPRYSSQISMSPKVVRRGASVQLSPIKGMSKTLSRSPERLCHKNSIDAGLEPIKMSDKRHGASMTVSRNQSMGEVSGTKLSSNQSLDSGSKHIPKVTKA